MANRSPTAKLVGTSEVKDHTLTFSGPHLHAVATVEPCNGKEFQPLCGRLRPMTKKHSIGMRDGPIYIEKK